MSEEYFDILDENGNKTGKVEPRSKAHRDGDWHRSVHIWVLDKDGDIILQRRSPNKENSPNMITISCAGHVSAGDDSLSSAVREGRPDVVARLCMVVDWCIDHPEYTAKIKVIPKKDYPILMPCEF